MLQELPDSFFQLPKLQELTLVNNNFNEIPSQLASMDELREIYLNGACGRKKVVVPAEITKKGILKDCYDGQI